MSIILRLSHYRSSMLFFLCVYFLCHCVSSFLPVLFTRAFVSIELSDIFNSNGGCCCWHSLIHTQMNEIVKLTADLISTNDLLPVLMRATEKKPDRFSAKMCRCKHLLIRDHLERDSGKTPTTPTSSSFCMTTFETH